MKAKKLPDVWVVLRDGRIVMTARVLRPKAIGKPVPASEREVVVRYTPAKPAKVCVWTERDTIGHDSGCGETTRQEPFSFCPYCRGKIKVKR